MEAEFIQWLRERLPAHPRLLLGAGDDAAILSVGQSQGFVITSDLLSEGVHFVFDSAGASRVGRKALAVNLSDLAAMAARPLAAVVSLLLPQHDGLRIAQELYEGLLPLAFEYDLTVAGGDTNCWRGPLVVSVTAVGETTASGFLRRSGAEVGDAILVTGTLGGSILGRQFEFEPRVAEALLLNERYTIHAAMDISDGLALDLSRICLASGVGAEIETASVPVSEAAYNLAGGRDFHREALLHALGDGEDFELLMTLADAEAERLLRDQPLEIPLKRIGLIVSRPGLWEVDAAGNRIHLEPRGYVHQ
jgi:thiamine-monophosphate kinase